MQGRGIKPRARLETFVLAIGGGLGRARKQSRNLMMAHRFEGARRLKRLFQNLHPVDSSDDRRSRQTQSIVQALHWRSGLALENVPAAHRFHSQDRYPFAHQPRKDLLSEAPEMC